ncbi:hypothetical protein BH24ACT21_BH24ACT21_01040 [soil metagenome]
MRQMLWSGPSCKPDPVEKPPSISGDLSPDSDSLAGPVAAPTRPDASEEASEHFGLLAPVVYLAGPSQDTAGGLLPHPFTHHLCRQILPTGHRLVCSLLHLT